jgi:hypothetical protein
LAFQIKIQDPQKIKTFSILDYYGRYLHMATDNNHFIMDILKHKPQLITSTLQSKSKNIRIYADHEKKTRFEFDKEKRRLVIVGFNNKVLSRVTFNAVEFELYKKLQRYYSLDKLEKNNYNYINRISSLYESAILKKVFDSL